MYRLIDEGEFAVAGSRHQARTTPAFDDRRIVAISRNDASRRLLCRRLDHAEQSLVLRFAVDHPTRVEYFVPAMLRVCLRKHHQLCICRVTPQLGIIAYEVIDFLIVERQPELGVRGHQRVAPFCRQGDAHDLGGLVRFEQRLHLCAIVINRFSHAIEEQPG